MKTKIVILFFLISTTFLSGCGQNGRKHASKKIFKYNESSRIETLDPAFARDQAHIWICNQLYNGLVQLDDSLHIQPAIARHWQISPDGKTYTFYLRNDVFFYDDPVFKGKQRKVIALDFQYSFRRIVDPATASPGSWIFANVADSKSGKEFIALNDSVLQIKLKQAFPPFLGILSMQYCSVVPREAIEYYGINFRRHPVGTGPFFLKNWVENIKMVLRKNPNYFETDHGHRLPYLDGVSISFLTDKMTAFLEFAQGNFDFISGIAPSYKDELLDRQGNLRSKYKDKIYLLKSPYLNTEYLGILIDTTFQSVKESPLKLKKIRQAIQYGFNRKKMIRFLRNGIGIPGNKGMIPKGMPAYNEHADYGYTYNPEKSRQLLHDAGFNSQNPVPPVTLITTAEYVDLCKYVQSQLQNVGMDVHINVLPAGSMREMKAHQKLNFFRASWIADYPDEENYLSLFYSKNFAPNGPNYTHFSNKQFDSLYERSLSITDRPHRTQLYRQMDSLVMEQSPVIILYYDEALRFVQKNIKGMTNNAINLLNLKKVRK